MKFACDKCATKYSIADDRVKGRVLKIRCKSCNHVITVREEGSQAAKLPSGKHTSPIEAAIENNFGAPPGADESSGEHTTVGGLPPGFDFGVGAAAAADAETDNEWYVSFDGDQEGPFSLDKACERVKAERPRGKEIHCWRPGFFVWLPIEEVPEFAARALASGKPPAVPSVQGGRSPVPAAAKGGAARTSSASMKREPTSPTGGRPVVPKDPTGPRAALAVASPKEPLPALSNDSRPMPLPPPPDAPSHLGAQVTKPEPRNSYRRPDPAGATPMMGAKSLPASLHEAPTKKPVFPAAKPAPKLPLDALKQAETRAGKAASNGGDEVSPFAAALAASAGHGAPGHQQAIPDTGPTPLPPPPGDELPIGEASGLLNLSHLASAAAAASARPVPRSTVETFGGVPVTPSVPHNGIPSSPPAPVVVMAGPAPRHTQPWIKWAAIAGLSISLFLGGTLIFVLTRPPLPGTNQAVEPSRHMEDKPIAFIDPANPNAQLPPNEPQRQQQQARKPVATKAPPPGVKPPAAVDPNKGLTAEQKRLRDLYGDNSESSAPHALPNVNAPARKSAPVNEGALAAVVSQNKNSMGLCYQRVLKHDPSLRSAKLNAHVKIGISGRVTGVSFADPSTGASEIGTCLTQSIKRWNFPSADSEYEFEFPIVLQAN